MNMVRTFGISVTVFASGWILMGLEIVSSRMLAPYFGSGIGVWGSIISLFLAALSLGYVLGGALSKRLPSGIVLAGLLALTATVLVPVAVWYPVLNDWIASLDLHENWGSLLAAAVLFLFPCLLLGTVSPYAVQLITHELQNVGARAGALYALSTLGSCLGCLITAFYFIVWFGIRQILYGSAVCLLLSAIWLALTWRLGKP